MTFFGAALDFPLGFGTGFALTPVLALGLFMTPLVHPHESHQEWPPIL